MAKPILKYHQAVRGVGKDFVTSLCDSWTGNGRLVDNLWDVPRDQICLSCSRRIPYDWSTAPAVIVAAEHFANVEG